ncbi:DUF2267 domain-containing protein [Pyxidicoccus parkwayensis]|uniref:DUF2267 domain-containing protein n=1 Tax=Pyxidicoccus parkwayensis TaxID=2813578 RepID=A0ABX7P652_9BACT|nr:DUF2267 domain-containing protein [Pyxidicoccus parkwaysis]QSQ25923.1 DUF2267 domain-containing protein [Pyxidicoccus parkwaysis]
MAQHTQPPDDVHAVPVKERDEPADLQSFLAELQNSRELQVNKVDARAAADAVFCTLARRLSVGEDVKLMHALGTRIGKLIGACSVHLGPSHARRMTRDEFMTDVADHLRIPVDQAFRVVTVVFTAIRDRIPEDEVAAVASQLPADLADLFRRPV